MQPLESADFDKIRALFAQPYTRLPVAAFIAGTASARVWVDNAEEPRSALIWAKSSGLYLGGAADNPAFNRMIGDIVADRVLPELEHPIFKVHFDGEGWRQQSGALLPMLTLIPLQRALLTLHKPLPVDPAWHAAIPLGFALHTITEDLLIYRHPKNLERLRAEIETMWPSLSQFMRSGFGYCLLRADAEIVAWCTAEYVSGDQCGIGIETLEDYQGRGFATFVARAFVEHCRAHSIRPHWDSWSSNLPALAVARKVGFVSAGDYTVWLARAPQGKAQT
ncbi:MAG: GNAT family N-acetyltransferase [Chloroflexi bacterium]|nr:GNAT family N-acetyltransferase [Chloroflexota bacterium]